MQYPENGTIGYAQINALSWRVASELSRRNSSLLVGFPEDGGSSAHADALMLVDSRGLEYQARRRGLGFAAFKDGRYGEIKWDRAFEMATARQITIALETSVGIQLPDRAPKTTRRALSYRVLASILEMMLGDSHSWTVTPGRGGPLDPTLGESPTDLRDFDYCRWDVRRNEDVVATVDIYGYAEVEGRRVDLHKRYDELGRRVTRLTVSVFGSLLP